jgi:hypothetical protein
MQFYSVLSIRFEIFSAHFFKHPKSMNNIFWDMTSCSLVEVYRRTGGTFCRLLHGRRVNQASKRLENSIRLYGVTSNTIVFFIVTVVRTSDFNLNPRSSSWVRDQVLRPHKRKGYTRRPDLLSRSLNRRWKDLKKGRKQLSFISETWYVWNVSNPRIYVRVFCICWLVPQYIFLNKNL